MAIMYDPGMFPALLEHPPAARRTELFWRNGGLPQLGNISRHLHQLDVHVHEQLPNKAFAGVGVLDFESWRPIFRQNFGVLTPYKVSLKRFCT